jgi:hypothetical protein
MLVNQKERKDKKKEMKYPANFTLENVPATRCVNIPPWFRSEGKGMGYIAARAALHPS